MLNLSNNKKQKRSLQQLSDGRKFEAIAKVQKGETKAAVAREFGVPESTLRGWCKKAKLNNNNTFFKISSSQLVVPTIINEVQYKDSNNCYRGNGHDEGNVNRLSELEDEENDFHRDHKSKPDAAQFARHYHCYDHHQPRFLPGKTTPEEVWNLLPNGSYSLNNNDVFPTNIAGIYPFLGDKHFPTPYTHSLEATSNGLYGDWHKNGVNEQTPSSSPNSFGSIDISFNKDEPLALVVQSKRRILEDSSNSEKLRGLNGSTENDISKQTPRITMEEALRHGEVFLSWLQECSDPNVSVLQAKQIATLIKNIKSSHQRNQSKNQF